jgi:hypothetical protein
MLTEAQRIKLVFVASCAWVAIGITESCVAHSFGFSALALLLLLVFYCAVTDMTPTQHTKALREQICGLDEIWRPYHELTTLHIDEKDADADSAAIQIGAIEQCVQKVCVDTDGVPLVRAYEQWAAHRSALQKSLESARQSLARWPSCGESPEWLRAATSLAERINHVALLSEILARHPDFELQTALAARLKKQRAEEAARRADDDQLQQQQMWLQWHYNT